MSKMNKKVIVVSIIIILVAIIAALVYFYGMSTEYRMTDIEVRDTPLESFEN